MKKKNKIIISLIVSLTIIGFVSCLIWNKNKQEKVENNSSREKKKENNQQPISTDEQLTSYFFVVFISIGILFLIGQSDIFLRYLNKLSCYLMPYKVSFPPKNELKYFYLIFIETISEIIVYEKNVNLINNKDPLLNFDFHRFLDQFLFGSQVGKHQVRQEAQTEIMEYLKKRKQRGLIMSLTKITIIYLLTFLFNFIINFFQHGLKTWKRLKWNSIFKMIPNLKHKYERVITYFLFFLKSNFVLYFFDYHLSYKCYPNCILQKNDLGRYWLVKGVFNDYYLWKLLSSKVDFTRPIYLINKQKTMINHRNLDAKIYPLETDFDDRQRIIDQGKQFQTEDCRKFVNDMGKILNPNNQFEQEVLTKVKKFVNNEE